MEQQQRDQSFLTGTPAPSQDDKTMALIAHIGGIVVPIIVPFIIMVTKGEQSPWVKQDAQALRLFRAIDGDGNGRIDDAEWAAFQKKKAGDKGYLNTTDLRNMLAGEREPNRAKRVPKELWTKSLFAGDLGSAFEGPRVDQMAPDFTLPRHHGKGTITLSEFRGMKPVVLIFGSFT